jgi:Cu(I)/Ag(I) efflux system protein CusF
MTMDGSLLTAVGMTPVNHSVLLQGFLLHRHSFAVTATEGGASANRAAGLGHASTCLAVLSAHRASDFAEKDEEEHTLNVFRRMAGGALMLTLLATVAVANDAAIDGEVMKINESSGSITLKHGPAPSLGFKEGVTMVYEVRDRALLKQLKVGDTVKFEAESGDDGFTVTKLQKSSK